jgi:hypothetical protein
MNWIENLLPMISASSVTLGLISLLLWLRDRRQARARCAPR